MDSKIFLTLLHYIFLFVIFIFSYTRLHARSQKILELSGPLPINRRLRFLLTIANITMSLIVGYIAKSLTFHHFCTLLPRSLNDDGNQIIHTLNTISVIGSFFIATIGSYIFATKLTVYKPEQKKSTFLYFVGVALSIAFIVQYLWMVFRNSDGQNICWGESMLLFYF